MGLLIREVSEPGVHNYAPIASVSKVFCDSLPQLKDSKRIYGALSHEQGIHSWLRVLFVPQGTYIGGVPGLYIYSVCGSKFSESGLPERYDGNVEFLAKVWQRLGSHNSHLMVCDRSYSVVGRWFPAILDDSQLQRIYFPQSGELLYPLRQEDWIKNEKTPILNGLDFNMARDLMRLVKDHLRPTPTENLA